MIFFLALIPATALTIAGYFVLYLSNRSEGASRNFGKYLGFWAFTLAGLIVLGSIFAAARCGHQGCMMGAREMHGRMHAPWRDDARYDDPRAGGTRDADRVDEALPAAVPPAPPGAANATAPPAPASPAPR